MFEGMLARRYIGTQKRHSALTVCSIAIALALITMLFSVFSTVIGCLRNIAYDEGAYHVTGRFYSEEDYNAFAEAISDYGTYTLEVIETFWWNEDGTKKDVTLYDVDVMFDGYIGTSVELLIDSIGDKIGIGDLYGHSFFKNEMLIMYDMIDVQSAVYMVAIIALFYVFVLFLIMMLRLIIDTAFEISSKERERQFGVLQSIGATPQQTVRIITCEGLMLSVLGIPLGVAAGIGLGYAVYRAVLGTGLADLYLSPEKAAELVHFSVNPWLLLLGVVTGAAWVLFSAYGTGMRVIKMSPVQAISQRSNTVKKVHRFSLFGKIFGWTGKIASRNNMRQPKRFIATVVSLTMSIALFSAVTVVVNNLQSKAEKFYAENTPPNDFEVYIWYNAEDPLGYRQYIELFEESGLFGEVAFQRNYYGTWVRDTPDAEKINYNGLSSANIVYYSKDAYNRQFDGNPPVSYEELAESGKYILGGQIGKGIKESVYEPLDSVSAEFKEYEPIEITEEEYNALSKEEKYNVMIQGHYEDDVFVADQYFYHPTYTVDFGIYLAGDYIEEEAGYVYDNIACWLIGTIDQYENGAYKLFDYEGRGDIFGGIGCVLANDGSYYKALELLKDNFSEYDYTDFSADRLQLRALLSSVKIITTFFSILIALIAVVNMVNIISTGILNRRGELAAMQCVGMTERQLYKMTLVECLQYALTSGIAAVVVCLLLMFFTEKMLLIVIDVVESFGGVGTVWQPLPIIGIASLCAFVIAITASIIPLRAMQKTSLVEQIRSVE